MPSLAVPGADIHYSVSGNGPPLLLIAGTACDGTYWSRFQVPDFSRDFTVITFDQRGTGKTQTHIKDYSTHRLAADCAALIDSVGLGPAYVVGHSMGGRVAQLVALDHGQHVKALILASTGSSFKVKGGISAKTCLGILEMGYVPYVRKHSTAIGFSQDFVARNSAFVADIMDEMMATLPPVEIYFAHILSRQDHETTARLPFINCPTLVMVGGDETHGTSDTTHVESSRVLARGIPNCRFEIIEGQGHFYSHSAPDETNKLIRDWILSLNLT
jgi:pimeloyl-ACP methyl ester carboxylesterase